MAQGKRDQEPWPSSSQCPQLSAGELGLDRALKEAITPGVRSLRKKPVPPRHDVKGERGGPWIR